MISKHNKDILDIYKRYLKQDLPENLQVLYKFADALTFINEAIVDSKAIPEEYLLYHEPLLFKFYLHTLTIHQTLSGVQLNSQFFAKGKLDIKAFDQSSAYVLLRAQFESYLTYSYLYVNPKTIELKKLRFHVWMYSALLGRSKHPTTTKIAKEQKEKDKKEMERIWLEIEKSWHLSKLTKKQMNQIKNKGKARMYYTWRDIMNETGITEETLLYPKYAFLSDYAHSEGLSVLQQKGRNIRHSNNHETANLIALLSTLLVCAMIPNLTHNFKSAEIKYNTMPSRIQTEIRIYTNILKEAVR